MHARDADLRCTGLPAAETARDGAFDADGGFTVLPPIPRKVLEPWFRADVLALLRREGRTRIAPSSHCPSRTEQVDCHVVFYQ
ncbi:MAG: hypothetical protein A3H97_17495 [Acidobacteria bacterium RIFCSPLOWO2_02_FULL_65_29]|nr:MAG: hypothetical protein A3H97_17495 [Acidobacteria bacterium RIFCSPLOWO2_02_FULL_65_29]